MVINSFDAVMYTAIFLLPGYVIERIVNMIYTNSIESDFKIFFRFFAYSIINLAVLSWAYNYINQNFSNNSSKYWFIMVSVTLLGSIIISLFIGIIKQNKLLEKSLRKLGFSVKVTSPTAWDYIFFETSACFITVTLKNGVQHSGYFGSQSCASSEVGERDIYIETLYDNDSENGVWEAIEGSRGIYIKSEEISTIEYLY